MFGFNQVWHASSITMKQIGTNRNKSTISLKHYYLVLPQYHIVKCQIRDNIENKTKMNYRNKDGRIFTVLFLVGDVVSSESVVSLFLILILISNMWQYRKRNKDGRIFTVSVGGVVPVSLFLILCSWCKCSTNSTSYTDDAQHTATENRRKHLIFGRYG